MTKTERQPPKRLRGLYQKFIVKRTDGRDAPGKKHDGCDYFVLDLTHDQLAVPALMAYRDACRKRYPALSVDLTNKLIEMTAPKLPPSPRRGRIPGRIR